MLFVTDYKLKPPLVGRVQPGHPLAQGLIGCWLFNERSGYTVHDASGQRNNGSLNDGTTWGPSRFGLGVEFESDGYVDCGGPKPWNTIGDVTVSLWVKDAGTGIAGWVFNKFYSTADGWGLYKSAANYLGIYDDIDNADSGRYYTAIEPGDWYHVVASMKSLENRLYLDGVLIGSGGYSADNWSSFGGNFYIAARGNGSTFYDGVIDHVMVWRRALSDGEVAWLYREPFAMFDSRARSVLMYIPGQAVVSLCGAAGGRLSCTGGSIRLADEVTEDMLGRAWLRDALFAGMTANAFKLGTTLGLGWFWVRLGGCSALYRGPGMDGIEFGRILSVDGPDAETVSPPDWVEHESGSRYFYVLRRFNRCGIPEQSLGAAVAVSIGGDGGLAEREPNKVFSVRAEVVEGEKVRVVWFYSPLGQQSEPTCFNVYSDGGTGQVDYADPLAMVSYRGCCYYSYVSDGLSPGRYLFAVRARDAEGAEDGSTCPVAIELSGDGPNSAGILNVGAL